MPPISLEEVREAISDTMENDYPTEEIVEKIESSFPELDETYGIYTHMLEPLERKRSIGAMLGIILLSKNDYDSFVEAQKENCRMTPELWDEWQRFLSRANMTPEFRH